MDDLVARLRAKAAKGGIIPIGDVTIEQAADELEKLLAAISGWRDHYGWKDGEYVDNINEIFEPLGGVPDHAASRKT